jgi:hypothetical protein
MSWEKLNLLIRALIYAGVISGVLANPKRKIVEAKVKAIVAGAFEGYLETLDPADRAKIEGMGP